VPADPIGDSSRETRRADVTRLLQAAQGGDRGALDALLPVVYDELRRLAASRLRQEREGHTLQPTALAHEAWLQLVDAPRVEWRGRAQFLAVAARAMRQVLVDHARTRGAQKRGGDLARVTLFDEAATFGRPQLDLLALDEALETLGATEERKARVVELRFFSGLEMQEIASVLGVSDTTVENDWYLARAWLRKRLKE
jgi:RNA polymerase sigma factor (TIGR02999 family)